MDANRLVYLFYIEDQFYNLSKLKVTKYKNIEFINYFY